MIDEVAGDVNVMNVMNVEGEGVADVVAVQNFAAVQIMVLDRANDGCHADFEAVVLVDVVENGDEDIVVAAVHDRDDYHHHHLISLNLNDDHALMALVVHVVAS